MGDTKRTITCPACDKEMTKVYLKDAGCNVDICLDGCGGVLFDNRELQKVDEEHENADEIFEALKDRYFKHVNEQEVRICSVCGTPMVKQGSGTDGVEIDVCNVCGAVFLDYGELEKIRQNGNNARYNEAINASVDAFAKENEYRPAGIVGDIIRQYFPSTGMRNTVTEFINRYLSNK